jgi:hypothetical protein
VAVAVAGHPLTNLSAASALSLTMVAQTRPRARAIQLMALPVAAALAALVTESGQALVLGGFLHGGAWLAGDSGRSRCGEREEIQASLGQIEEVGRTAMADLDQILGLLEADPLSLDLAVSVRHLVAGLPGHLRADLTLDGDLRDVTGPVGQTVHRVIQESLTNVVRHASATTVCVRLSRTEEDIVIEVADDGNAAGPAAPGRGLNGMRERVRRLGGTCRTGPDPSGGWRVDARIPAQPS